eukprot:CAMPEP_0181087580 /NCGR_PEP_ID=MMETSP1071-20121207/6347_1 /TAXON_ID=35127 /ORGANISM="Thalassiosira sp., Strain NH16" /LENGTH=1183 /DNA_ID=CAMNT_0023169475 /DNA_START=176 /DNA_END=3724 /DNA_ORIENTATION=-
MSHALSALDHAIRGDPDGLSFIERTASIYVLDAATTPGHPTTYGWWNFLNDALNDVERYESEEWRRRSQQQQQRYQSYNNLDAHVRLLATVTRRVARRPPSSDRRLVGTCLANASTSHMNLLASADMAQSLLNRNAELRERNMGRIAAIVFDFSFHRRNGCGGGNAAVRHDEQRYPPPPRSSAFSDPAAMEQFCGVVAANAVSTGPRSLRHLVSDWVLPAVDSLPPLAVAAIMSHVAAECAGRGRPAGIGDAMSSLVPYVLRRALGPILIDSLRESDGRGEDDAHMAEAAATAGGNIIVGGAGGGGAGGNIEHRTAALALRALESWCEANSIGAVKLRSIFSATNINILEAIADALYSNAEILIDAVSDLIETLLRYDARDANVTLGISIAGSVMSEHILPMAQAGGGGIVADQLLLARQVAAEGEKSRISILSELVSAVGLQRFRFAERQSNGDTAVCRCLARTAAGVLLGSQDVIKDGTLQVSTDGLLDLLFKAASHPSVYVCGIAVEALATIAPSNGNLSTRLLPYLQGKAIIPFHLVGDANGSLEDYVNFRDRVLADALIACYKGCSTFYLESCGSAIQEFCQASLSPHLPYQLEAALFCMIAVSERASKTPNEQVLCGQLERMILALEKNSFTTTSHVLVMSKMCRFISEYAACFLSCESETVFDKASELVIASFDRDLNQYKGRGRLASATGTSPLSEASNALKQLFECSTQSPAECSTFTARSGLERAWRTPYTNQQIDITVEDREMLCSGLCSVIISLAPQQWIPSLDALTQPILSCLNVITKEAHQITSNSGNARQRESDVAPIINRLSNEIRLLTAVVTCFIQADVTKNSSGESKAQLVLFRHNALVSLLHKSWPCLTHIAEKYCSYEAIASSIGRILSASLSLSEDEEPLLIEITGLAKTSLSTIVKAKNPASLIPLLTFMQHFINMHGSKIELNPRNNAIHEDVQIVAKNLMLMAYQGVRNDVTQGVASPMFDTLSSCAKQCPLFLLILSRDSQPDGEVIRSSIEAAPATMKSNETDVVLSSTRFLKELASSLSSISLEALDEDQQLTIKPIVDRIKYSIQTDAIITCVGLTLGISPPEVLDPLTDLIRLILTFSQWPDIEPSVSAAINCSQFQLGDEAKSVVFEALKRSTMSEYIAANFGTMISDMWNMHQSDDTGSIAGGEAVSDFVQR